jgi:hypothetical protein
MTVIKSSVFNVLETFPDRATGMISNACSKKTRNFNPSVKIIASAPKRCNHWNQSNEKEAPKRRQEYAQLLKELVDEICLYLNQSDLKRRRKLCAT